MKESAVVSSIIALQTKIAETWRLLDLDTTKRKIAALESQTSQPDFWSDQENAKKVSQGLAALQTEWHQWNTLKQEVADLVEIARLDKDDQGVNLKAETEEKYFELAKRFSELEFTILFNGEYDRDNAVVAIHAGAGGVDAQDWAEMLQRMILKFCEQKNFTVTILDTARGAEAGIKGVVMEVVGRYAYGCLKSESGVHRLVRISPFDAEKMRHTSFAMVEVIPELDDVADVNIKDEDLRIDVFRSGGKGGQSVNTTDSAVRIVHIPTGITVNCQNERSQRQNKEHALKILKSKLHQYYQTEVEEERQRLRGQFTAAAWGNQARSYVLQPYKLVKDHRSGYETNDVEGVLAGELQLFVEAYLKKLKVIKL
ncbi:peptide chain release factor 2 [Candidatus Falkowbacteria bacterium]|nr:peptide chain release factor 2 [Candidatus Falkowbacteria bacterium]